MSPKREREGGGGIIFFVTSYLTVLRIGGGGGGDYNEYINYDYERGLRTDKRPRPRDRDSGYVLID